MTETRRVDRTRIDVEQVLSLVRASGLVGHGGGGFPTATKIDAARRQRPDLIVNACDGEPLVHKDTALLERRPLLLADGIAVLQEILRPRRTLIAVHGGNRDGARHMITTGQITADVLAVPDRYVSSEASALAAIANGGDARPRYRDRPLTAGAPGRRGRSTLVLNAETVARLAAIVLRGSATDTRLISLAGDLQRPTVIETSLHARLDDLVLGAGPMAHTRAVLVGGYGGRWYDAAGLCGRTVGELGSDLGAGLVMVHADGCPLRKVAGILAYLADQTAGQCGPCMFGLPAIASDWQALLDPAAAMDAEQRLRRRLPTITGRGACHHPDGAVTMAASALQVFGTDVVAHRTGRCVGHGALVGLS